MIKAIGFALGILIGAWLPSQLTTEYPIQYSKPITQNVAVRLVSFCDSVPLRLTYGLADTAKFTLFTGSLFNNCIAYGPNVGSSPDTLF